MEYWNSIEQLGKISNLLQILLVIFGIVTGLIGAGSFAIDFRKNHLVKIKESQLQNKVSEIEDRTSEMKSLTFRELTDKQKLMIKNSIKNSNAINVLAVRHNSKESQHYSIQIEKIFEESGWKVEHFMPATSFRDVSDPKIGLHSKIKSLNEFDRLKKSFEAAGLPFTFDTFNSDNVKHELILDVGIIPANDFQIIMDKIN